MIIIPFGHTGPTYVYPGPIGHAGPDIKWWPLRACRSNIRLSWPHRTCWPRHNPSPFGHATRDIRLPWPHRACHSWHNTNPSPFGHNNNNNNISHPLRSGFWKIWIIRYRTPFGAVLKSFIKYRTPIGVVLKSFNKISHSHRSGFEKVLIKYHTPIGVVLKSL